MDLIKELYEAAQPLNACGLFTGQETFEDMIKVFLTPQGIEFCIKNDFPDKSYLRPIKERNVSEMGIWIDAGEKELRNERIVVLVGNCNFKLVYDTLEYPCKVVLMKGARAKIIARGFSVVKIEAQEGCEYKVKKGRFAVVK